MKRLAQKIYALVVCEADLELGVDACIVGCGISFTSTVSIDYILKSGADEFIGGSLSADITKTIWGNYKITILQHTSVKLGAINNKIEIPFGSILSSLMEPQEFWTDTRQSWVLRRMHGANFFMHGAPLDIIKSQLSKLIEAEIAKQSIRVENK